MRTRENRSSSEARNLGVAHSTDFLEPRVVEFLGSLQEHYGQLGNPKKSKTIL